MSLDTSTGANLIVDVSYILLDYLLQIDLETDIIVAIV